MEVPLSKARDELAELVNRVAYGGERITLVRRGQRVAVLVSARDLEVLEVLEDAADLEDVRAALADPENQGPAIPWAELEEELDRRR